MKYLMLSALLGLLMSCAQTKTRPEGVETPATTVSESNTEAMPGKKSFYDFTMTSLEGKEINFSQYKGKKVLVVNTASKCGFTPQYAELEKLNKMYGNKVVILGFPANNFGGQEPGSNEEIAEFCEKNYGVDFQMFEKSSVKGDDKNPLYQWLTDKAQNGWNDQEPTWNFCKYLIDEQGNLIKFFPSKVEPMSEELLDAVQS
ncbi:glutathione peroxidase [Catalinimonas alkaloidigena]|uniref:Glutathione peroxidase n=1 Tax=Catalinimonas alkaloidigena TaxID=1075417 RepID=A0A1G8XP59_9BACT|nr:glutathione peroxidase [Catalinimonas alkaloidigena]SDJ92226.1 glutathione peroxidase [Catalinimonas alkaloidigena]